MDEWIDGWVDGFSPFNSLSALPLIACQHIKTGNY